MNFPNPAQGVDSGTTGPSRPRCGQAGKFIALTLAVWLCAVVTAMAFIARYSHQPGTAGTPPAQWPVASAIPLSENRPTLVMFVHPRCPCSRASLGELAVLLAQSPQRVNVQVVFLKPAEVDARWLESDIWRQAELIYGATLHTDEAGAEAERFHSQTSGDTMLYDVGGKLLFHGGITAERGHAGDNAGRSTLLALLKDQTIGAGKIPSTPVFGCALFPTTTSEKCNLCTNR